MPWAWPTAMPPRADGHGAAPAPPRTSSARRTTARHARWLGSSQHHRVGPHPIVVLIPQITELAAHARSIAVPTVYCILYIYSQTYKQSFPTAPKQDYWYFRNFTCCLNDVVWCCHGQRKGQIAVHTDRNGHFSRLYAALDAIYATLNPIRSSK